MHTRRKMARPASKPATRRHPSALLPQVAPRLQPHEEDTEAGLQASRAWARDARPERRPFDARTIKLHPPDATTSARRSGAPPDKFETPERLGVTILGHLLCLATLTTGHMMDLSTMEGIVHIEQVRGKAKTVRKNTVWLGYAISYGPAATGTEYKHTVEYVAYLDVDSGIMVPVDPPLREVRELLTTDWPRWQLVASAPDVTPDPEGGGSTWRTLSLTRELRCPNPSCQHIVGVGEEALGCSKCVTLDHRSPSTGLPRTRAALAKAEGILFAMALNQRGEAAALEDPTDQPYVYKTDEDELTEDEDLEEDELARPPPRSSLQAPRRFELLPGMLPVDDAPNYSTVTPLQELDGDDGATRAAQRAQIPLVFEALSRSPRSSWSDTQRTATGNGTNATAVQVTAQAELGLFATAQGGAHMNLLEVSLGGQPIAVTKDYLQGLAPNQAAELVAQPVPLEHSQTYERLLNPDVNEYVLRCSQRDEVASQRVKDGVPEWPHPSLLHDARSRRANHEHATKRVLFPLLSGDPTLLKCEAEAEATSFAPAAGPVTTMLPSVLHNVGAHAVSEATIDVEGEQVRCLLVDPSLARTALMAQRSGAATHDPHSSLAVLSADEATLLDKRQDEFARHIATTISITTKPTHFVTNESGLPVPRVVQRCAVISRSPHAVAEALLRIDTGTRTISRYRLLERREIDALILQGLMPVNMDTLRYIRQNCSRSTMPAFAKRTDETTLRRLAALPLNRVRLDGMMVPRTVSAATAAVAADDDGGDDETPLPARTTPHGVAAAAPKLPDLAQNGADLAQNGAGSPDGAMHASKLVHAMMGSKDDRIPGTGTVDALLFGLLGTLALLSGVDLHDVHAEEGSPQRQLARLTEQRRMQVVGSPYTMLDGKAPLIGDAIAAAVQLSPDGGTLQEHEDHCRAIVDTALALFPLHASVGARALAMPFKDLPVVKDVDYTVLTLPDGLNTLGAALAAPGASRLVALRMLRALSHLRSACNLCSVLSNRMNMSWYPLQKAEDTHQRITHGSFANGTDPAALHVWSKANLDGWPKLALSRALMLGAGAPGLLSEPFRDADIPAQPGVGFQEGILNIAVSMVPRAVS